MDSRIRSQRLTFAHPFPVDGRDELQPAGSYLVEIDEERLEGLSFVAWRRVQATIRLDGPPLRPGVIERVAIGTEALEVALAAAGRDHL